MNILKSPLPSVVLIATTLALLAATGAASAKPPFLKPGFNAAAKGPNLTPRFNGAAKRPAPVSPKFNGAASGKPPALKPTFNGAARKPLGPQRSTTGRATGSAGGKAGASTLGRAGPRFTPGGF
ncbi:hypothetical protein [Tropicimonas sp. S265A]|uniref:hypothetical protein n=1 Tax=Tropicimonas sp. S265A TaxID=3415134 RepID=UPI003C7AF768